MTGMTRATFQGLFKYPKGHTERPDARRANHEELDVLLRTLQRRMMQRNTADKRIVKPSAFSGKEGDQL